MSGLRLFCGRGDNDPADREAVFMIGSEKKRELLYG